MAATVFAIIGPNIHGKGKPARKAATPPATPIASAVNCGKRGCGSLTLFRLKPADVVCAAFFGQLHLLLAFAKAGFVVLGGFVNTLMA